MNTNPNTNQNAVPAKPARAMNTIAEEFCDKRAKDTELIRRDFRNKELQSAIHGMKCQIDEWKAFLAATESALAAANIVKGDFGGSESPEALKNQTEARRTEVMVLADTRNSAIAAIKVALKARSKTRWSVTGGTGTAYGWLTIHCAPSLRDENGNIPAPLREELAKLLGLESVHQQGVSISADTSYRREYVARARYGEALGFKAEPYWD